MTTHDQTARFVSATTGIAIVLPLGWRREEGTEGEYATDVYYETLGEAYSPCITIKRIPLPEEEQHPYSYLQLSEIILAEQAQATPHPSITILEQTHERIDRYLGRADVFRMVEPETGIPIVQYVLTVQLPEAVCGLVAVLKAEDQAAYLPLLKAAARSMTFDQAV
jgi:hypothetical protein